MIAAELDAWMTRLEARHLADLTFAEVVRALRALSSTYVERRHTALAAGRALDSSGKRAAFALYYGPLHYLVTWHLLDALGIPRDQPALPVLDYGCGTGAIGAAVAIWTGARRIRGVDVHPWAVAEARDTYAGFGLDATVSRGGVARCRPPSSPSFMVAGFVANELPDAARAAFETHLDDAVRHGSQLLVIEPLSGRAAPWWSEWAERFGAVGARVDSWTLTLTPPDLVARLGAAAGLTPTRATVRSIAVWPARRSLGEGGRT